MIEFLLTTIYGGLVVCTYQTISQAIKHKSLINLTFGLCMLIGLVCAVLEGV